MTYKETVPCQTKEGCPLLEYQVSEEERRLNSDGKLDDLMPKFTAQYRANAIEECQEDNEELEGRDQYATYLTGNPVSPCVRAAWIQFMVLDRVARDPEILED